MIPSFERAQGGTHHNGKHIRLDRRDGVRSPKVHGEKVAGRQKLGRGVEERAKKAPFIKINGFGRRNQLGNVGEHRERTGVVEVKGSFDRSVAFGNGFGAGGILGDLSKPLESIGCRSNVESQMLGSGRYFDDIPER